MVLQWKILNSQKTKCFLPTLRQLNHQLIPDFRDSNKNKKVQRNVGHQTPREGRGGRGRGHSFQNTRQVHNIEDGASSDAKKLLSSGEM